MSKYRFKTREEFKNDGLLSNNHTSAQNWNDCGEMDHLFGLEIDDEYNDDIETLISKFILNPKVTSTITIGKWYHRATDFVEITEIPIEETLKKIKTENSLIIKTTKMKKAEVKTKRVEKTEKFVFMDKTASVLEIGYSTGKNIILYGPGGHGKSEMTLDFFQERGIEPYVITMGTGMTTDRLFGGLDITQLQQGGSGKIEYLVENSFMNHEYVVFEEMFDAPDFILEQLKDILSSGIFRNGTQIFHIKTKFIVCCTNRTRDEFSKNMSLKALMERFPLELNVIWDNYTEISYNKLLESKFGVDNVDPVIPYLLQEYARNGVTISPRIAVTAYQVYEQCGPESLSFIAEFSKKPTLIADAIKKFESTIKFREMSSGIQELIREITDIEITSDSQKKIYSSKIKDLEKLLSDVRGITVNDDLASVHAELVKGVAVAIKAFNKNLQIASFV